MFFPCVVAVFYHFTKEFCHRYPLKRRSELSNSLHLSSTKNCLHSKKNLQKLCVDYYNIHAIIFNLWSCFSKTFVLAGLCSGLTEGVFINPFEVVKVKLQTEQQHFSEVWPSCYKYFVATSAVEHGTDLCIP